MDRENQRPVEHWEASNELKDKFSVGFCSSPKSMHSECSNKIIKAHTVPKSSSLKAIAVDGHVYGFNFSLETIRKYKGRIEPELIGINRASTFTGFCKFHDDRIFSPIEKNTFSATQEQCFLLAYRAFTRECYTKSAMANLHGLRSSLDKGRSIEAQMDIQMKSFLLDIGSSTGVRDNAFHKDKFDQAIEKRDFSSCQAIVFEFDDPPPVMVSGAINPDFDFSGKRIQDLGELDVVPNVMAMNSFYDGEKGYIVMSWLEHSSKAPKKLLHSFLSKPRADHEKYLVQYMFKNFENCFIAPKWWDATEDSDKKTMIDLMADTVSFLSDPNGDDISSVLIKVGFPSIERVHYVNWEPKDKL